MAKGKHTLYSHDLQMLKNLLMQCPVFRIDKTNFTGDGKVVLPATDYKALWELKMTIEEILEDVEE